MRAAVAVLAILLGLAAPSLASAATTYHVTREDDPSPVPPCTTTDCSLRSAVAAVNAGPGGDTIVVAPGMYSLGDELSLDKSVTITGAGARTTTITATGGNHRLFRIEATSELRDLRLTGGFSPAEGGAVLVGIGQTLTVLRTTVEGNRAYKQMDSVYGGAFAVLGILELADSLVSGNRASPEPSSGQSYGGGIATFAGATTRISNSTITGNVASSGSGSGTGGGIWTEDAARTEVVNSTIAGNHALYTYVSPPTGGNIWNGGVTKLTNTILADGDATQGTENCDGVAITSLGYNLADTTECALDGPGDREGVDPALGALADNGGPTNTLAIAASSPAFDAAPLAGCPAADQRGVTRPQGAGCDIGAFELGVSAPGGPPPADTAPEVTNLTVSPKTFVLGSFLPTFTQRRPVGTTIAFGLSEPASTTLAFTQRRPGRRVRGRCVKPRRGNRGRPRCRRTVVAAKLQRDLLAGQRRIRFSGRVGSRKRLRPGRYQLVVTALDQAGLRSAPVKASMRARRRGRR